jgi:PII-like signaling protein
VLDLTHARQKTIARATNGGAILKPGGAMLTKGPAKKVTIFINEDARHHMTALHDAIMTFLIHKGVSGATATRAFSGFGAHGSLHTPNIEALAEHLPVRIEFIETPEKVDDVLPTLYEMVADGLIEVQDTTVVKHTRRAPRAEARPAHVRRDGHARLLRIFLGERDRWHGEPLYDAIVKKLRMMEIAGATVYRGILGYGAKGHEHKQSFFHVSRDLPIMISAIDTVEKIAAAAAAVEAMMEDGLIVISEAEIVRMVRSQPEAPDVANAAR